MSLLVDLHIFPIVLNPANNLYSSCCPIHSTQYSSNKTKEKFIIKKLVEGAAVSDISVWVISPWSGQVSIYTSAVIVDRIGWKRIRSDPKDPDNDSEASRVYTHKTHRKTLSRVSPSPQSGPETAISTDEIDLDNLEFIPPPPPPETATPTAAIAWHQE